MVVWGYEEAAESWDLLMIHPNVCDEQSLTSDLFSQKAEWPQEFPAVNKTLFGRPPGDPLPESDRLSGHHGLVVDSQTLDTS